jgi:hypothetical protein
MEFAMISSFFAAMVWWEIILFLMLWGVTLGFLFEERGVIPLIGIAIFLFVDWTGNGAIITFGSMLSMWLWLSAYFLIGLGWSFFKWGRLVNETIIEFKNEEDIRFNLKYFSNDTIAYWIIWWPLSVLGFIFDDLINWIITKFRGVYRLITDKMIDNALQNKKIKPVDYED